MREIGIDVKRPTGEWDGDENCPFYGSLRLRGQMFEGVVSGVGMQKTITIERNNVRYMKKYERFEKRTSALSAHLPVALVTSRLATPCVSWNAARSQDGLILCYRKDWR